MLACKLGRIHNVKLFLDDQKKKIAHLDPDNEEYQFQLNNFSYVNTIGPKKNTALHYAAKHGFLQIVKALLEEGEAKIDEKNTHQNTPLTLAAEQGHLNVVEYLVNKGANIHGLEK